jgi:integrase
MTTIKVRNNKNGEQRFQSMSRVARGGEHYQTHATLEDARAYGLRMDRLLSRERALNEDPFSWLPESGEFKDERLVNTIKGFERTLPEKRWAESSLPAVKAVMGDPKISDLCPSWIKKYIRRARKTMTLRGSPYAWSSIHQQLCVISKAIKWRADELNIQPPPFIVRKSHFIEAAAAEGLRKEALDNSRFRRLEPWEEKALFSHLARDESPQASQWPLLVRFAMHTGARLQEMVLMEWDEVHESGEWWDIPWKHSKTKGRTMLLTDEAIDTLRELSAQRIPGNPRVFHTFDTPRATSAAFAKIRDEVGLVDFVFHDLRHEGISRFVLTQIGLPVQAIMGMVGHSSLSMLRRYTNLRGHELAPLMRRRAPVSPVGDQESATLGQLPEPLAARSPLPALTPKLNPCEPASGQLMREEAPDAHTLGSNAQQVAGANPPQPAPLRLVQG